MSRYRTQLLCLFNQWSLCNAIVSSVHWCYAVIAEPLNEWTEQLCHVFALSILIESTEYYVKPLMPFYRGSGVHVMSLLVLSINSKNGSINPHTATCCQSAELQVKNILHITKHHFWKIVGGREISNSSARHWSSRFSRDQVAYSCGWK